MSPSKVTNMKKIVTNFMSNCNHLHVLTQSGSMGQFLSYLFLILIFVGVCLSVCVCTNHSSTFIGDCGIVEELLTNLYLDRKQWLHKQFFINLCYTALERDWKQKSVKILANRIIQKWAYCQPAKMSRVEQFLSSSLHFTVSVQLI